MTKVLLTGKLSLEILCMSMMSWLANARNEIGGSGFIAGMFRLILAIQL